MASKPVIIVEVLKVIEELTTEKWSAKDGTEGYGAAPNLVAEAVYERLIDKGLSEELAQEISDYCQQLVEPFVVERDGELTYM